MQYIAIGGDVSKGRLDIAILNESGTQLHCGCYDDTAEGHARLASVIDDVRKRHRHAIMMAGVESTGGLERNWLAFFGRLEQLKVHRLNPMAVKRYLAADLHRAVTDAHAAIGIARFLLERMRDHNSRNDAPSAAMVFYRGLRSAIDRRVEVEQQIHALLIQTHPELVQYCRSGMPEWIMHVLDRYPTAAHLARARKEGLDQLPFAARQRAIQLVSAARTSVAGLTGEAAAAAIGLLVRQWRDLDHTINDGQRALAALVANDPLHARQTRLLASIPGIGEWTASILSLEIGDMTRFHDDRALIAWAGLDPHEDRSGDGIIKRGISHRGNAQVRRALFMPVLTASKRNVVIAAMWDRMLMAGKPRLVAAVACMSKLLRMAYAIVLTNREFDPNYEARRKSASRLEQQQPLQQKVEACSNTSNSIAAPITAREARRRTKAVAQGSGVRGQSPNEHRGDRSLSIELTKVRSTDRDGDQTIGVVERFEHGPSKARAEKLSMTSILP